jgi:hypothetical protein
VIFVIGMIFVIFCLENKVYIFLKTCHLRKASLELSEKPMKNWKQTNKKRGRFKKKIIIL